MSIKLMYITNRVDVAKIAEKAGVDRIFIDMEYIGKSERQGGMDTVQNHHTLDDISKIKKILTTAKLMCRINPIHNETDVYGSSREEIDSAIESGADILMLPYFKTVQEVRLFIEMVKKRVKTVLLIETPEAVEAIEDILKVDGIDEVFIGLNDLSIAYGKNFMFELLADGTVERLCLKFKQKGIPYGFGGIAALGSGTLPSEYIIKEHYRLGSTCTILSRSFCNVSKIGNIDIVRSIFEKGICEIRQLEDECEKYSSYFRENEALVTERVRLVCEEMKIQGVEYEK